MPDEHTTPHSVSYRVERVKKIRIRTKRVVGLVVLVFFLLGVIASYFTNQVKGPIVIATVNGQPIYLTEFELRYAYKQVPMAKTVFFDQLLTEYAVFQLIQANASITEGQIDKAVAFIQFRKGLNSSQLQVALLEDGLTMEDLRMQLGMELLLEDLNVQVERYLQNNVYVNHSREDYNQRRDSFVRGVLQNATIIRFGNFIGDDFQTHG